MRVALISAGLVCLASAMDTFMNKNLFKQEVFGAQNDTYKNASLPYTDVNMSCSNCIRGGYDFCLFRTFPDNTTHFDFTNCTQWAITPELNSESTVAEKNRWICSGAFKDQLQALNSMCAAEVDYNRDEETCGPYVIDLTYPTQVFSLQLANL